MNTTNNEIPISIADAKRFLSFAKANRFPDYGGADALMNAPWGVQPDTHGRVRIADYARSLPGEERRRDLYLDGAVVGAIEYRACHRDSHYALCINYLVRRARDAKERAERAEKQARYLDLLDRSAADVVLGIWPRGADDVADGQGGGRVRVDGVWLSLPGLFRRAGVSVAHTESYVDAFFARCDSYRIPAGGGDEDGSIKLRKIPARWRRLPMADVRRVA